MLYNKPIPKQGLKKIEEIIQLSKADLHIHSNYSDGAPSVEEILDYVEHYTDLDVIAITDHDTLEGSLKAQTLTKEKNYRFELIVGEEISSQQGHILGLFLKEKIEPGLSAHEVLLQIKKQGGIAIASHPFVRTKWKNPLIIIMNGVGLATLINERTLFDAVEIVNATPTLGEENIRADFINKTVLFRGETGSSDAHILAAIGKGYTLFEGKTAGDLHYALKHHQTKAMFSKWTLLALFKYIYFFIPLGLRIGFYTFMHRNDEKKLQSK